ncbi:MAG: transcription-repair coupling factor [Candidatus Tectimicrobiota bacterium]
MKLFDALRQRVPQAQRPWLTLSGVTTGAKGYILARLFAESRTSLLVVTPDAVQRDLLTADLQCFLAGMPLLPPRWPGLAGVVCRYVPRAVSPAMSRVQQALEHYQPLWRLLSDDPVIVVSSVESLRYGVIPAAQLQACLLPVRLGESLPLHNLAAMLVERGYQRVSMVENVGEFALRGGILDFFSPGYSAPVRMEFFGEEVESIRTFDLQSQTSTASLQTVLITPMFPLSRRHLDHPALRQRLLDSVVEQDGAAAAITAALARWHEQAPVTWPWWLELFGTATTWSPYAYLPDTGLLCGVDVEDIQIALQQLAEPAPLRLEDTSLTLPATHWLPAAQLAAQLQERMDVALQRYTTPGVDTATVLHLQGAPQFFGGLERFLSQLQQWQAAGLCLWLLCHTPLEVRRVHEWLASCGVQSQALETCTSCLTEAGVRPGAIWLSVGQVSQGFVWPEAGLVVLRHADIFGEKKQEQPAAARHRAPFLNDFATLRPGDRLVHIDYGVGRFRRMTFLDVDQGSGEFMELEYADGATLYVPSYRLSMIQKYTAGETDTGHLDRLGGNGWSRTKERVKAALFTMAADLVQLHATRQMQPGHSFSPDTALHRDFENGFEYVETEDQLRAIQEVLADMEQPRPMERLVCGDVGYGKTEVAMRAAFKAIYDNTQVALLVPTTVLAQQHFHTLQRRFAPYPVHIELLSRLRKPKEQRQILDKLQQGTVDIVIGTHRLLQKDVQFKSLGLLVVDEEHRFGVVHKEKIKQLAHNVDVLMLTATPIPRSLHMSMVGLRDCSIIATPPEGRSAIETIVTLYSEDTITRAIQTELARGGQIFFVHNRIDTLPAMQALLQRLVPQCRIGIAHGQMPERTLDAIMLQFFERQFDLLLCTTIIESGLDVAAANTIIINHAETFGLAQLYQLRGRVGRSAQQAYAYLLIPGDLLLSDMARKRIEALEEFSALGAGFHLASRDLEIRGAGNLLGAQQSGHIASVGFDLYCQMLGEAIRTLRGEDVLPRIEPELRLEVQGYLPATYVDSEAQRLELYRRLSGVETLDALRILEQEIHDRFGAPPLPVTRLFLVIELKLLARYVLLERIEQRGGDVLLTFHAQTPVEPTRLLQWLQATAPKFRFQSERVVRMPLPRTTADARLALLKKRLQQLHTGASM